MWTKSEVTVGRTGHVRLTGVKGHKAGIVNELIGSGGRAAVATTRDLTTAIQHVLYAQVNVVYGPLALFLLAIVSSNFDAIGKRAQCSLQSNKIKQDRTVVGG